MKLFASPSGPYRELQVFIDGQLSGVHVPFTTIYTGGIVSGDFVILFHSLFFTSFEMSQS